jgi:shikimate dehydrogenase
VSNSSSSSGPTNKFLLGLIGAGIQSSLTPAMHELECSTQGLRCLYQLIDLDELHLTADALPALLASAEHMGFTGLNITFPCKQRILPLLDQLSKEAEALGAVNTVVLRDGKRVGHNTDSYGFGEAFRRHLAGVPSDSVLQLGAGGAGAAVAYALLGQGTKALIIYDVDLEQAERLAQRLVPHFPGARVTVTKEPWHAVLAVQGLVNTTPVGMAKVPGSPLSVDLLRPSLWVADVIYFPSETELLRAARRLGCRNMNGGSMAVFQAVQAFHAFTGRRADPDRMHRHFQELCDIGNGKLGRNAK